MASLRNLPSKIMLQNPALNASSPSICLGCRFRARRLAARPLRGDTIVRQRGIATSAQFSSLARHGQPLRFSKPASKASIRRYANTVGQGILSPENQSAEQASVFADEEEDTLFKEDGTDGVIAMGSGQEPDPEGYVPASTWHGLRTLEPSQWDQMAPYEGFSLPRRTFEAHAVQLATQRALIECFILSQAELNPSLACRLSKKSLSKAQWTELVTKARFEAAANGSHSLVFKDSTFTESILASIAEVEAHDSEDIGMAAPQRVSTSESNLEQEMSQMPTPADLELTPIDQSWQDVSLGSMDLKFAVLKRTSQLLGRKIPDQQIQAIKLAKHLASVLAVKPKPPKLAKWLLQDENLQKLPNLDIMERRYTAMSADKEKGRAKLYHQALKARGLPTRTT